MKRQFARQKSWLFTRVFQPITGFHQKKLLLVGVALAASALACNYPNSSAPTPFVFETPDATLTAVFSPTQAVATSQVVPGATATNPIVVAPTATPPSIATTAVQQPAPTAAPPTERPPQKPVSYSGPGARNGPSIVALYQDDSITIDGDFDEWNAERITVDDVVAGGDEWDGDDDLSARLMVTWDDDYLYVAARVIDDQYVQDASGSKIFEGDSIEMLVDTNVSGDFYYEGLNEDDYQLGISPGSPDPNDDPESYLWFPQSEEGSRRRVEIGAKLADDGYRVEAAIPWSTFDINPRSGQHYGFAFSVSDNDSTRENEQQSMVSNVSTRSLVDPTTWGDLTLSGNASQPSTPPRRDNAEFEAAYFSNPPTLDGNLGDWGAARYNVIKVVYGDDKWDNNDDLSGKAMFAWDEDFLYIGAQVTDNRYMQSATRENIFLGDSLEVLLDAELEEDFNQRALNGDDYQLGISGGTPVVGSNPEAYLWFPENQAGRRTDVKIAAVPNDSGYTMEVAIPWDVFDLSPHKNQRLGFVFSISDNDHGDKAIQQSLVSIISSRVLTDPTTWASLLLVK